MPWPLRQAAPPEAPARPLCSASMKTLLIVYHSMTDGTRQMAAAAAAGAACEAQTVRIRLLRAADAGPADVLGADGYIFATPENLAAMAGLMKDFFDRSYYAALDRVNGRPFAVLICAGSDGHNAARQIERIATGWRLKLVAPTLIVCTHAQTPAEILSLKQITAADLARCEELGAALAAGLSLGVY
jgi:multimeric flavodoxin WrbA